MEIVDGECVFCQDNNVVLSNRHKQVFLDIVKDIFFADDNKKFIKFTKQNIHKSVCVSCAHKLNSIQYTSQAYKVAIRKKKKSKETSCSICLTSRSTEVLMHVPVFFTTLAKNFLNSINNGREVQNICIGCCYSLFSWDTVRSHLNSHESDDDLGSESDTEVEMVSTRLTATEKRSHSTENRVAHSPNKRLKRNEIEKDVATHTKNVPKKYTKGAAEKKKSSVGKPVKPSVDSSLKSRLRKTRNTTETKDEKLTRLLSHLKSVNTETVSRNMHLSYEVLIDKKMMFGIPYIAMNENDTKFTDSKVDQEVIILSSDDEPDNNIEEAAHRGRSKRRIISTKKVRESTPVAPSKKTKTTYSCFECNYKSKSNSDYKLHTLEHETSFSPVVVIELQEVPITNQVVDNVSSDSDTFHTGTDDETTTINDETTTINDEATEKSEAETRKSSDVADAAEEEKPEETTKSTEEEVIQENKSDQVVNENKAKESSPDARETTSNSQSQESQVSADQQNGDLCNNKTDHVQYTEEDINKVINKYLPADEAQEQSNKDTTMENIEKHKPGPKSRRGRRIVKIEYEDVVQEKSPNEETQVTVPITQSDCGVEEENKQVSEIEADAQDDKNTGNDDELQNENESTENNEKPTSDTEENEAHVEDAVDAEDQELSGNEENENISDEDENVEEQDENKEVEDEDLQEEQNKEEEHEDQEEGEEEETQIEEEECENEDESLKDSSTKESINESPTKKSVASEDDENVASDVSTVEDTVICNGEHEMIQVEDKIVEVETEDIETEIITTEIDEKLDECEDKLESDAAEEEMDTNLIDDSGEREASEEETEENADVSSSELNNEQKNSSGEQFEDAVSDVIGGHLDEVEDANKPPGMEVVVTTEESHKSDSDIESLTASSQGSNMCDKDKVVKMIKLNNVIENVTVSHEVSIECSDDGHDNFKEVESLLEDLGA